MSVRVFAVFALVAKEIGARKTNRQQNKPNIRKATATTAKLRFEIFEAMLNIALLTRVY